jgi:iron complex transport system ATP-binding protein
MPDAIVFEGVEVRVAGAARILGPVSWRVAAGDRWAVLRPNGSGKTTLLSVAGAWRQPSAGRAVILGAELGRTDVRSLRERIGHVGHTVTEKLRPELLVRDVVLTGRSSTLETWFQDFTADERGEAEARLDEVGCLALADRPLGTCSQGERARVLLARASYARHELLLLDEPAAGLDLPAREQLVTAMERSAAQSVSATTVLATHHLEELPPGTTHTALLRDGAFVAAGPVEETLTDRVLSQAFGMAIAVERRRGRWAAFANGS